MSVSAIAYVRQGIPLKLAFIEEDTDADDRTYIWYDAIVTKIIRRGQKYVDCSLEFCDDGARVRTVLRNNLYLPSSKPLEDSWKFGISSMNLLVEELKDEREKTRDMKALLESYQDAYCDGPGSHALRFEYSDDYEDDDDYAPSDDESSSSNEEDVDECEEEDVKHDGTNNAAVTAQQPGCKCSVLSCPRTVSLFVLCYLFMKVVGQHQNTLWDVIQRFMRVPA